MVRSLAAIAITAVLGAWSFLAWSGLGMAQAGSPLAVDLPFNQATAAQRQLLSSTSPLTKAQRDDLALLALRRAPLSAQPLAYLALVAEQAGDEGRTQFLIDAASPLGWHDEAVQRILYNWAASGNDHAAALRHAEALLRQDLAAKDLTTDFTRKTGNPRFRAALVAMLSKKGAWADRWVGLEAQRLDDASLGALFASRQFRQARSAESLTVLAARLVQAGRTRTAWRLAHGDAGAGPLRLDWQAETDFPASDVFGWQVPASYALVQGASAEPQIKRQDTAPSPLVRLRLGLAPGRYRVSFPGAEPAAVAGWTAGFTCDAGAAVPTVPVGAAIELTVDQACQQQALVVAAEIGTGSALPLPVLQSAGN